MFPHHPPDSLAAAPASLAPPLEALERSAVTHHSSLLYDAVDVLTVTGRLEATVAEGLSPSSPEGWVWEAEMLQPGLSLNGNTYYTPEFIRQSVADFEGCPCYADHQSTPAGSIRNVVGSFRNVHVSEQFGASVPSPAVIPSVSEGSALSFDSNLPATGPVLRGELHLLKSENWIREKLLAAHDAGMPMGLSINAIVGLKRSVRDGREVLEPQKIIAGTPRSVDLVMFPAAGGRVLRAIAGSGFESALDEARRNYQSRDRKGAEAPPSDPGTHAPPSVPWTHSGFVPNPTLNPSRDSNGAVSLHHQFSEPHRSDNPGSESWSTQGENMEQTYPQESRSGPTGAVQESLQPIRQEIATLRNRLEDAQHQQRIAEAHLLVNQKLAASRLPEPLARLVRERFRGGAPTSEDLDTEIGRVREAYAAVVPSPTNLGSRAIVFQEPEDRYQIALDKLCGLRKSPDGRDYDASVPAFRGIQEAYVTITNDRGLQWEAPAGRITEEWNAAGFADALGNTLYRRLVQDYRDVDYGLDTIIPPREPHRVALRDFRTHEIVRVGYLSDLDAVDPEQTDWPEIVAPTDEKASISAVQFGGLVTVTRKTIINDDIGLVAKIASRIGRAARRTMAQRVYNLLINNGNIYDGVAFFHATHGNLGTTALGVNELDAIRSAMRNQTEKDSAKKLGIGPWALVVPVELEGAAKTTNTRQYIDSNFTPNKVQYMFGNNNERVVVSPLLTDANDWFVFANPDELQTFELGFLQGKAEPELLLADNQVVGKAFTSDRIQYKVRHEYEVAVVDFRGAYKEAVA